MWPGCEDGSRDSLTCPRHLGPFEMWVVPQIRDVGFKVKCG